MNSSSTGTIHTFSNGFEFIHNPSFPHFLWTSKGYMDTPDARKLFRSLLREGLTYTSTEEDLFGFERNHVPSHTVNFDPDILDWRDVYSATK